MLVPFVTHTYTTDGHANRILAVQISGTIAQNDDDGTMI